jgi:hypothetical protein
MKKLHIAGLLSLGMTLACAADDPASPGDDSIGVTSNGDATGEDTSSPDTTPPPDDDGDSSNEDEDEGEDQGLEPPRYDVNDFGPDAGEVNPCVSLDAGVWCVETRSVECDDEHNTVSDVECIPSFCQDGYGCLPCVAGMYDCHGPHVVRCDTSVLPHVWETIETCDPAAGEGCDIASGTCVGLSPIGGTEPTGEYYQYVDFTSAHGYNGGYDVDGHGNRLYVTNYSSQVDVYEVEVLDSDGNNGPEPNQHPDNEDAEGPIEDRELTYIESIPVGGTVSISVTELFALEDRIFIGGTSITETLFDSGDSTTITTAPAWASRFSQIGYDDIYGVWYGANESYRRVMVHDAATDMWGLAFYYPDLVGSHMDGLEVVTDPQTGTPFVYVSDMTSDFIGQYRKDPDDGWTQHNLFSYQGTVGSAVEGMGFGPNAHFWVCSGSGLAELGGGDIQEFVGPGPAG